MKTISRIVLAAALVSSVAMTGCAYNSSSPDVYTASQAQREETVRMATVESVRGVKISSNNGQPSGLGAIGGGALGAVAGSAIGGGTGSIMTGHHRRSRGRGRGQRGGEQRRDEERPGDHRAAR